MTSRKRIWAIQDKVHKDMEQTVFYVDKEKQNVDFKGNPSKFAEFTERGVDPYKFSSCPFCLSYIQVRKALISTKKGFDRGQGMCPVCGKGMKLATLTSMQKWTPVQYAKWVFEYRGFWKKVNMAQWKKHLAMMHWSNEFWTEYKRLRGDQYESKEEKKKIEDDWDAFNANEHG